MDKKKIKTIDEELDEILAKYDEPNNFDVMFNQFGDTSTTEIIIPDWVVNKFGEESLKAKGCYITKDGEWKRIKPKYTAKEIDEFMKNDKDNVFNNPLIIIILIIVGIIGMALILFLLNTFLSAVLNIEIPVIRSFKFIS